LAVLPNREHSSETPVCDLDAVAYAYSQIEQFADAPACAFRPQWNSQTTPKRLNAELSARKAVLLMFCNPMPEQCSQLLNLSTKQWVDLLRWLDLSGLALYFLNRLIELDLTDLLPPPVFTRLHLNLIDNTARTRGMINESIAIQKEFQKVDLSYAILKGLSFWPKSAPKPELRCQFDLDFLVGETDAPEARRLLEERGYRLYAISGRSWEFKRNERPGLSLKHLYKNLPSFAVELHIEPRIPSVSSPLDRREWRDLCGMKMPVLSPVDLLLGQGLHAYKHVCGEFARAAHLLEFRRHVLSMQKDSAFWSELKAAANQSPRASLGLGVITLLITSVMGEFAPEALTGWTVNSLSGPVRLWVETYGHRAVLGSHPGSKLYLLLQSELESAGISAQRPVRRALVPLCLPQLVIRAFPNESLSVRIRRHYMQLQLISARLRFHVVEGIRIIVESRRWRRMKSLAR
jgi:hypothetical protein